MKENTINIWDQDLNYKLFEAKNPQGDIIILHWWWGKSDSWIKVWKLLQKESWNVYIPDLPGFWKSPLEKTYTIHSYAKLIEYFLEKLQIRSCVIMWHSNGWAISTRIASNRDIEIQKLILNNSAWVRMNPKRKIKRMILKPCVLVCKKLSFLPFYEPLRKKIYTLIGSADYANAEAENIHKKATYQNMITADMSQDFLLIQAPTLLLWWEKDTATPLSDAYTMQKSIEWARLHIIGGHGHSIHLKDPIQLSAKIIDFLKQ